MSFPTKAVDACSGNAGAPSPRSATSAAAISETRGNRVAPLLALLAISILLLGAGSAQAATVIGNDLTRTASNLTANTSGLTLLQTGPRDGDATPVKAPVDGVLTKVRMKHGGNPAAIAAPFAFRLLSGSFTTYDPLMTNPFIARPATPDGSTAPQLSIPAGAAAGGIAEWVPKDLVGDPVGVPIRKNEYLGVYTPRDPVVLITNIAAPGGTIALTRGDHTSGSKDYGNGFPQTYELLVQGTIEPDADGDRYGDETQDGCPTLASTHGPCVTDTTPPQTTIDSGPSGTINTSSAIFAFSSTEAGTFECKLDGPGATTGTFASCTSPKSYSSLADGAYTFSVRATDAANNTAATPATRTFTVNAAAPSDTTPPQTTIDSGPSGTITTNSASFTFSSEAGSTFECKLDGPGATTGTFASCSSPKDYTNLADGTYTFSVRATDVADNTDASPATDTFTVSTAASPPPPPFAPFAPAPSLLPPPPGPAQAADTTRPLIGALSLSRRRFRAAGSGPSIATALGTKVSYTLSEPASVSFRVERALSGRRIGGRCVRTTRANRRARRCTRYSVLRGGFAHSGKAGQNAFKFSGRLGGRKLRPGRYRLRAIATDKAGNKSLPKRTGFRIVTPN